MHTNATRALTTVLLAAALVGCSTAEPLDDPRDTDPIQPCVGGGCPDLDLPTIPDMPATDGDMSPVNQPDMTPDLDAAGGRDMAQGDHGMAPDAATEDCSYLDLEMYVVDCNGTYRRTLKWVDIERRGCTPYWTLGDNPMRYPTREEALTAGSCATDCIWRASVAVDFLHCDHRNGYHVWTNTDGMGDCPDLLEFSDGFTTDDLETWKARNPC